MEYRNLGSCGLKVSRLCLGTMMFGGEAGEEESLEMMRVAVEAGINFFDTADWYNRGGSEEVIGRFLKGRRDELVIATKVTLPTGDGPNQRGASRKHIRIAVEASLRRLDTDYIDIYYLHKPDPETPIEESLAALDDLISAGKVLYAGVSNFRAWQIARAIGIEELRGWDRLVVAQPLYNIANRDCEVELLPMCAELGLGAVSYSPIARGVLTGKYAAGSPPPEGSRAARGNKHRMETYSGDAEVTLDL
ncbi:MAG: aldo/keto reductase [Armatimonadetes bacterium]|nr:aldo/keto reductase [Armatimonadota bacterium]